jgi:hypothetical protein
MKGVCEMNTKETLEIEMQDAMEFRYRKAQEYPHDERNNQAAEYLEILIRELNEISDFNWQVFEEIILDIRQRLVDDGLYGTNEISVEELSYAYDRIGFGKWQPSLQEVIQDHVEEWIHESVSFTNLPRELANWTTKILWDSKNDE